MCKYCEQKPSFLEEYDKYKYYQECANEMVLATGNWTALYIGVDKNGQIVLRARGDGYTDDCLINYCPFCGKKLRSCDSFWDIENNWNIKTDTKGVNNVDIQ